MIMVHGEKGKLISLSRSLRVLSNEEDTDDDDDDDDHGDAKCSRYMYVCCVRELNRRHFHRQKLIH